GSKLGAAFLYKRAEGLGLSDTFGARHLGEPAGGRAQAQPDGGRLALDRWQRVAQVRQVGLGLLVTGTGR
ncbi:hypothetical protein R0G64_32820, partial [Pseudomonas otitidis]|nr:hypothetical protein [Pseudomonas otitidis]